MASWKNGVLVAALVFAAVAAAAASKFDGVVQPSWANDHVLYEDDLLKLRLDSSSGKLHSALVVSVFPSEEQHWF
jgi:xyloglucan:xyloglucosyl transferase